MPTVQDTNTIKIALIPGDGIGIEVTQSVLQIIQFFNKTLDIKLEWDTLPFSADYYLQTGNAFTADDLGEVRTKYKYIFAGAFGDPRVPDGIHAKNILLGIRQKLDLYVNLRPCYVLDDRLVPLKGRSAKDVAFTIVRENTEGLYCLLGGKFKANTEDEVGLDEMITTRKGVKRIVEFAIEYAKNKNVKRITLADKANVLSFGHEIWRRTFYEVGSKHPDLKLNHLHIDAANMEMIRRPEQFDVIVTENLFGDIISDIAAELQGGLGFAASASFRPGGHYFFEPVHGSAPDIAGQNKANPIAAILSAGLLYEALGLPQVNERIRKAIRYLLAQDVVTYDIRAYRSFGRPHTTTEFTSLLVQALETEITC